MEYIEDIIKAYKEDNPHIYITDEMIKEIIEENLDILVKEVKEVIND